MRRFLCRCTALLLAVAAVLWLGGTAYRQTTTFRNLEWNEGTEPYRMLPEKISFAVFGSSHGREDFRAEDYGEGFFNFSLSSQTPQYDLMQLREFADRIRSGATVVLTVSYVSPFWTDTEEAFENKQERYYRILGPKNIVDCDVGHWVLGRWSPLLTTELSGVLSAFLLPPELLVGSETTEGLTTEKLEGEQERIRRDHLGSIEPTMPEGNSVMLEAYREIVALCEARGWNAVLVTPPYPRVYTDCFSEEILSRFRSLTGELSGEFGVPWLDYSQSDGFREEFSYFRDIDHLNAAGAAVFAQQVQAELAKLGFETTK